MNQPRRRATAAAITLLLAGAGAAQAQSSAATPPVACAEPQDMNPAQLYGLWQLTLWSLDGTRTAPTSTGALLFERHPDHPGSVRGHIRRSAAGNDLHAFVSGDVTAGEFNLDESTDGVSMDAVWSGTPQDCGQVIRGTRRPAEGRSGSEPAMGFLLRKTPDWR